MNDPCHQVYIGTSDHRMGVCVVDWVLCVSADVQSICVCVYIPINQAP